MPLNKETKPNHQVWTAHYLQFSNVMVRGGLIFHIGLIDVWNKEVVWDSRYTGLVFLHKKDSKSVNENYISISLLSTVSKIFSRILLNRLTSAVTTNILTEFSVTFMIFCVKQLQEKCKEQNLLVYHCLIDFSKAFDTE